MEPAYVRTGELREGRSVLLDETVPLAGRVQVPVQHIEPPPACPSQSDLLARIRPAARLRAAHVFLRTPDAIHLAAAIDMGCDRFLTSDQHLGRFILRRRLGSLSTVRLR